jgi:hypothetical protein
VAGLSPESATAILDTLDGIPLPEGVARMLDRARSESEVARLKRRAQHASDLITGVPRDAQGSRRASYLHNKVACLQGQARRLPHRPLQAVVGRRERQRSCGRPRARRRARAPSRAGPSDEGEGDGEGPPSPEVRHARASSPPTGDDGPGDPDPSGLTVPRPGRQDKAGARAAE